MNNTQTPQKSTGMNFSIFRDQNLETRAAIEIARDAAVNVRIDGNPPPMDRTLEAEVAWKSRNIEALINLIDDSAPVQFIAENLAPLRAAGLLERAILAAGKRIRDRKSASAVALKTFNEIANDNKMKALRPSLLDQIRGVTRTRIGS